MQYSPEQVRLMLIDSEKTCVYGLSKTPHLIQLISNRENATQSCLVSVRNGTSLSINEFNQNKKLGNFNQKMEETNELSKLIARCQVVDNPIIGFEQISALFQPLPRIVVNVSELKELILDGIIEWKNDNNIAQKACAAGIHLILSTNYPFLWMWLQD